MTFPTDNFISVYFLLFTLQPVGQALIYTLQKGLEEKFNDEVKEAWVTLYGIVQKFMTQGMQEGVDTEV